jgi:hypothetical protein
MRLAIIVTIPDDRPLRSTLGRVLKGLLRRHGLKCIDIRDVPTPDSPAAAETTHQTALDARSGIGMSLEPSKGVKCGRIDAGGSGIVGAGRQGSLHRGNQ